MGRPCSTNWEAEEECIQDFGEKARRDYEEDQDLDGWIILKWILHKMEWYGLDWSGSGKVPVEDPCEHENEPSGSIKCCEALE
jgi:hypothetical protein